MIEKPGIYFDVPASVYHADPVIEPSLSRSVAIELIHRTPRHALLKHPRMTIQPKTDADDKFSLGDVGHQILLGGRGFVVLDFDDWRTKDAQAMRAQIKSTGKTPILRHQYTRAADAAAAVAEQLPNFGLEDVLTGHGHSEAVIAWNDPVAGWCRAMLDRLTGSGRVVDFKFTGIELNLDNLGRHISNMRYEFQQAFYERGLAAVTPNFDLIKLARDWFIFVFIEAEPPHAILPVTLPRDALFKGRSQVERACQLWARAKNDATWPMYSGAVASVEYPAWSVGDYVDGGPNE